MARHELSQGELSEHVATAVSALKDGYVIVAPLEHSYALIADAFFHDAVRALHVLRGDALGVAAQVAIGNRDSIDGIARGISADARKLMENFWPGLLSLNLKPQAGLSWDLGDGNSLDQISVRIPNSEFILEVLKKSGPVAIASAALVGQSPINDARYFLFGLRSRRDLYGWQTSPGWRQYCHRSDRIPSTNHTGRSDLTKRNHSART